MSQQLIQKQTEWQNPSQIQTPVRKCQIQTWDNNWDLCQKVFAIESEPPHRGLCGQFQLTCGSVVQPVVWVI